MKGRAAKRLVQFMFFVKRNANSSIKQRKGEGHEKPDCILNSKKEFHLQISQRKRKILTDPILSDWCQSKIVLIQLNVSIQLN